MPSLRLLRPIADIAHRLDDVTRDDRWAPTWTSAGGLRGLGLERYEAAFRENEIDQTVLPNLTAEDLKDLGVTVVGHRRKVLDAIAALRTDASVTGRSALPGAMSSTPGTSPEDRAERRQVTVMFSDLVGSTVLSVRMDPVDLREIISASQKCVANTVQRFGGFVAKYMGDGVLIYSGIPRRAKTTQSAQYGQGWSWSPQ
jgi:class 3 adenylate cyclase